MSYRDRDWDEPRSSVSIKRYVVPPDHRDRDWGHRRDDPVGDRELAIRRAPEREDRGVVAPRYERDDYDSYRYDRDYRPEREYYEREYDPHDRGRYPRSEDYLDRPERPIVIRNGQPVMIREARGPVYVNPRESDYDVVQRSEIDRDPYYQRRHRYDEDRIARREVSPGDSISQVSRYRDDQDYSSDDSMVYVRKTRDSDDHPNHRRHLAEGALVGVGAAEFFRGRRKRDGEDVSHGMGRIGKDVGAGALGAVAVSAASRARDYYRSKSRHRSHSFDDRDYRQHRSRYSRSHRSRSRSRSRSGSHSRAKTFAEIGLGAAALAGAVALARKKSNDGRRSRSRRRASSVGREGSDDGRSLSQRRKHMAGAGVAGAAVAGLVERARSKSRSRKGERSRSRSKLRQALPIVATGLGTAAATGLYEKNKNKKEEERSRHRRRRHSRSRSRPRSDFYPDPSRDSAGLIEYGDDPVHGNIPVSNYHGQPVDRAYYSDEAEPMASGAAYGSSRPRSFSRSPNRRHSRDRYISDGSVSESDSDRRRRRRRSKKRRDRKSSDRGEYRDSLFHSMLTLQGYANDGHDDPYEESYNPEPYPVSQPPAPHPGNDSYYPNSNYFPPPPGQAPHPANGQAPYNPAEYPPPPGAAPPSQPYGYASSPGAEPYAPRPRRADENVSANIHDGGCNHQDE